MKTVSLYLFLLLASLFASAQSTDKQQQRFAGLDKQVDRILHDWHTAGVAIAIVEKDQVVYAKGFGYRDYEKKQPVTPNTIFAIGSCTKAFTSGLLGVLREEGKLDFETPVHNYLPELVFYNEDMNAHVTLRDMMCHRTGLSRYDLSWYMFGGPSRDSLIYRIRYMVPNEPLRYKWQYNNFMFVAQGVVAEKITGKSWEENIKKRFFDNLSMSRSTTTYSGFGIEDVAVGYNVRKDSIIQKVPYKNIDMIGPAGSINSSVNDMANWVTAWINGGKFKGKQVIPRVYISDAIKAHMATGAGPSGRATSEIFSANYGLAWDVDAYRGHYTVSHGGNIDGFTASTTFYPNDSIGIVVLANQSNSPVPEILKRVYTDKLLGLKYVNWSDTILATVKKMRPQVSVDEIKPNDSTKRKGADIIRQLNDYAGFYRNNAYGKFEIKQEHDSLFAFIGSDKYYVKHAAYDIFNAFRIDPATGIDISGYSLPAKFETDFNGNISSVSLELDIKDPVIFAKTAGSVSVDKQQLQRYIGTYVIGPMNITVVAKEEKLFLDVPGQQEYTLVPIDKDKFAIQGLTGYSVEFNVEDDKVVGLTSVQPDGRFRGERKK